MSEKTAPVEADVPLRAPRKWFKCIDYAPGLRIELPFADEAAAVQSALAHLAQGQSGSVKVGYYGFRSRIIVYATDDLSALASSP